MMLRSNSSTPGMDVNTSDSIPKPVQNTNVGNNIQIINVVPKKKPVFAKFGLAAYFMGVIITGIYLIAVTKAPGTPMVNVFPFAVFGFNIVSFVCMLVSMFKEKASASRTLMALHIGTIILFITAVFRV